MSKTPTRDGFAMNWSVSCLAPVLLARLIVNRILALAPVRVVNLTTDTTYLDHIDLDTIENEPDLAIDNSYAASKLALEMFSFGLLTIAGAGVDGHVLSRTDWTEQAPRVESVTMCRL